MIELSFDKNKYESIHADELCELLNNHINLVDIREPCEYKSGHVPTARNVPMNLIVKNPEQYLDRTKQYYIICEAGGRSLMTCNELSSKGYNVINVTDGTGAFTHSLEINQ